MLFLKRYTYYFLVLGLILDTSSGILAQEGMIFESFRQKDGLSNNFVTNIFQDHQGFIWIGTENGLNRFDGHHFLKFRHNQQDTQSINNSWIGNLYEDSRHNLWVGARGGLNRLDRETGKFERVPILDLEGQPLIVGIATDGIFEDAKQNIWIITYPIEGQKNIFKLSKDRENQNYFAVPFPFEDDRLKEDPLALVDGFIMEENGNFWLTNKRGISRLNIQNKKLDHFDFPFSKVNNIEWRGNRTAVSDGQGNILVKGGVGLFFINLTDSNPQLRPFEAYFPKSPDQALPDGEIISMVMNGPGMLVVNILKDANRKLLQIDLNSGDYTQIGANLDLNTYRVMDLYSDKQNNVWVATEGDGIKLGTRSKKLFTLYQHDPEDPYSISPGPVRALEIDNDGNLWAGVFKFGLDQFIVDDKGALKKISTIKQQAGQTKGLPNHDIIKLTRDLEGNIWIASNRIGVIKMNPETRDFETFAYDPGRPSSNSLNPNRIWALAVDPSGKIWVGAWFAGLYVIDLENGQYTKVETYPGNERIRDLHLDKNGMLWISSRNGLTRMNTRTMEFTQYAHRPDDPTSLSNEVVWTSYVDRNSDLWVGTNIGLNKFNAETQEFQQFYENDGLPSNAIYGLLEDQNHNLWVSTNNGLARMITNNGEISFQPFTSADGLESTSFLPKGYFNNEQTGQLYFGTTHGLIVVEPGLLAADNLSPLLKLHSISTFNAKAKEAKSVFNYFVNSNSGGKVVLTHLDQIVDFTLADLSWNSNELLQYEYKLKGFNQQWMALGDDMKMSFSNLAPGNYTLQARVSSIDKVASDHIELLDLKVLPPWWKSWWAYTIYALFAGAIIYALYRFQIKRQLEKQETENLRALNEFKNQLYTNITHEFRTPLTVINGMAEQVEGQENVKTLIKRNSLNLLNLVNQILDLRKMELGKLKLIFIQADIVPYLRYIIDFFQNLAEQQGLQLHFVPNEKELIMDFDQEKLLRIISNLLSNAIKFTPKEGEIFLELNKSEIEKIPGQSLEAVQISVRDTGIGIPEEKQKFIFDRFYQVDNDPNDSPKEKNQGKNYQYRGPGGGTGIGLALTKELVTLMGGQIDLTSSPGKGTTFSLLVPISRQAPLAESEDFLSEIPNQIAVPQVEISPKMLVEEENVPIDNGQQLSLLVIEDSPDVRHYLVSLLEKKYHLTLAKDGQEGIDLAFEKIPDLIISDVMMPYKNGFEVCETLKNDQRTSHIPIVLLTAKASVESRIIGLKRGADAYLAKPFNQEELFIRLEKLHQLRQQLQARYSTLGASPNATKEVQVLTQLEDEFMQTLRESIEANLDNEEFAVPELCRAIGMSRSQLHRKVKALTNRSTTHYIRSIRLHKAKELLQQGDLNVTQVAYEVGFQNRTYFSRAFNEEFGTSPKDFTKN